MLEKTKCIKYLREFRAKNAIEGADENIIAAIHIMNEHGIDKNSALDQSSRDKTIKNEHGIDGWHYNEKSKELFIYQSKLSESKAYVLNGLNDLNDSKEWLEKVLIKGRIEEVPKDNHALFNLYVKLSNIGPDLKKIHFILVSLFEQDEIEESDEYKELESVLIKSSLNRYIAKNNGKLILVIDQFNLEKSLPKENKKYDIKIIKESRTYLRGNAHLDLACISLYSLIELYRQRGDILFDKNVRLALTDKKAKKRLVHPMEETFDLITAENLSNDIFPFYHIGVTISASTINEEKDISSLENPSIINGCQTITIAEKYLAGLEKKKAQKKIEIFKKIKVIAKVVVGMADDELREITNANNRQNPIEDWQLFSNEPIHIEIEQALKEYGVFYERQKGKFESIMKNTSSARYYEHTNGTYIKIMDLAQLICLGRSDMQFLQWAAKPSEIFIERPRHYKVFDKKLPRYVKDIIFTYNMFKAIKRGVENYLWRPAHKNDYTHKIYVKPIVKAFVYNSALLYFYQRSNKEQLREDFSLDLTKIAATTLVSEVETFCQKIITKVKNWYYKESKELSIELSSKRLEKYFNELGIELGIDREKGEMPFTENCINWK